MGELEEKVDTSSKPTTITSSPSSWTKGRVKSIHSEPEIVVEDESIENEGQTSSIETPSLRTPLDSVEPSEGIDEVDLEGPSDSYTQQLIQQQQQQQILLKLPGRTQASCVDEETGDDGDENSPDQETVSCSFVNANRTVPGVCTICLCSYEPGEEVSWSPRADCQHAFHTDCIIPWLVKNAEPKCPICRQDFCATVESQGRLSGGYPYSSRFASGVGPGLAGGSSMTNGNSPYDSYHAAMRQYNQYRFSDPFAGSLFSVDANGRIYAISAARSAGSQSLVDLHPAVASLHVRPTYSTLSRVNLGHRGVELTSTSRPDGETEGSSPFVIESTDPTTSNPQSQPEQR